MKHLYEELEPIEFMGLQIGSKSYRRGQCVIMISPPTETTGWHMSISCRARNPSWEEIRDAWYTLVPDADNKSACMILPRKVDYINIHNYCFHVHEMDKNILPL